MKIKCNKLKGLNIMGTLRNEATTCISCVGLYGNDYYISDTFDYSIA